MGPDLVPNPNQLSPRAAMGLPPGLADRLGPDALSRHADLATLPTPELVATLESPSAPMARRYAAGTLLAYRGDPRLQTLQPQMRLLPGARVQLGLDATEAHVVAARWRHVGVQPEWILKECPRHTQVLAPFAIARFPVTHFEFRAFLEDTGKPWLPSAWPLGTYPVHLANHPVWTVPPEAADDYAAWVAHRTGRRFRLPTEAEWEYAASQGDDREFPWGADFEAERANTVEHGPLGTTPVGMYPLGCTATGIDDLGGNVEEYTADTYRPYPGGPTVSDDLQLVVGTYRVARGGSFTRYADLARCRRRHGWYPGPIYAMGFRIAETL